MGNVLRLSCTQEKLNSSIQRLVPLCPLCRLSESMLIGNSVLLSRVVDVSGSVSVNQLQELSLFTLAFRTDHIRTLPLVNFLVAHSEQSVLQIWVLYVLSNQVNQLASFFVRTCRRRVLLTNSFRRQTDNSPKKAAFWLFGF